MKIIKSLSIVFPVYNDSKTVEAMITKSLDIVQKHKFDYEIIIVDDCCPEKSGLIAKKFAKNNKNIKVFFNDKNLGYGATVRKALSLSTKDWVLQTDGDNQYDLFEFNKMLKIVHNYDCIITFRYKKTYSSFRIVMSKVYNLCVRILFNVGFRDISTGLRLINRNCISNITLKSNSSFIGAEIAVKFKIEGYSVGEMGIKNYPRKFGRSSIVSLKSIISTIIEMFKIRNQIFRN